MLRSCLLSTIVVPEIFFVKEIDFWCLVMPTNLMQRYNSYHSGTFKGNLRYLDLYVLLYLSSQYSIRVITCLVGCLWTVAKIGNFHPISKILKPKCAEDIPIFLFLFFGHPTPHVFQGIQIWRSKILFLKKTCNQKYRTFSDQLDKIVVRIFLADLKTVKTKMCFRRF